MAANWNAYYSTFKSCSECDRYLGILEGMDPADAMCLYKDTSIHRHFCWHQNYRLFGNIMAIKIQSLMRMYLKRKDYLEILSFKPDGKGYLKAKAEFEGVVKKN